jgi:hypothetical protein
VFVLIDAFAGEHVGEFGVPELHVQVPSALHAPHALPPTSHVWPMSWGPALVQLPHAPPLQLCVPAPHTPHVWLVPFKHWQTDALLGNPLFGTPSQLASLPGSHVSYWGGT